jgi:Predicted ATPase
MLIRLITANFLSFEKEIQFDMFPNIKRTSLQNHIYLCNKKLPILKMAALYGANGSGKSNLLKGINFLKNLVVNKDFLNKDSVIKYFYGLKDNVGDKPIEFTIEFVTKSGKPFIYSVEILKMGIKREALWLSGLGEKGNSIVFERDGKKVLYAKSISGDVEKIISGWMEKNPFASLLTINNDMPIITDKNIDIAQKWFIDELEIIGLHSFNSFLISIFKNSKEINNFASKLFKTIGLGINSVKVKTENFDDWVSTHNTDNIPMDKLKDMRSGVLSEFVGFRNTFAISVEDGIQKVSQMMFEQYGKDGFTKDMDIRAQSDGTVRLLSLIPALFYAMKCGKTVIIDELDHSIHPHLVREIVRYFSEQNTNGQLIFTTHQTCLLNKDFIRTDEVWLSEKQDGASFIYSLNDFKIHHTINIENGYMEGRYGAIPFIGELNL